MLSPAVLIKTKATFHIRVTARKAKVLMYWDLFWEFKCEFYPAEVY